MSAPIWSGVGDLLAICQTASQLSKALGICEGSTSVAEYQDLRKELDTFGNVLKHVAGLCEQLQGHPECQPGLCDTIRAASKECGNLIKHALDQLVPKYHESLHLRRSQRGFKAALKKIQWALVERDRLHALETKLQKSTRIITVLVALAASQQTELGTTAISTQMTVLQHSISQMANRTSSTLNQIAHEVNALCRLTLNPPPSRSLDPTQEFPVTLEDAMGRQRQLPMDCIHNWEDLYWVLDRYFTGTKGHNLVVAKQFALEEHFSGHDIDEKIPVLASLRRGMKVDMSMKFDDTFLITGTCPRCRQVSDAPEGKTVQCQTQDCGVYFRVQKFNDDKDKMQSINVQSESKQPDVSELPAGPSDFNRVRLLRSMAESEDGDGSIPSKRKSRISAKRTHWSRRLLTGPPRTKSIFGRTPLEQ